jgi:hypothetical protein
LLAKVAALSTNQKCIAGDDRLAEYCTCTPQHIRKMTTELRDAGCLEVNGRGHTRSLAIGKLVDRPKSNHSCKATRGANFATRGANKATTVAKLSNHSCEDYRETIESTIESTIERDLLFFPWESDEFMNAWAAWKEHKRAQFKFKFKTTKSEQIALHKLHRDTNGDETNAIEAIASSIANGYRGIFPSNTGKGKNVGRNLNW